MIAFIKAYWLKLAGALASFVVLLSLAFWRRKALGAEAMREIDSANAQVKGLERLKEQLRLKQIDSQENLSRVDSKIEAIKSEAKTKAAALEGKSVSDLAKDFERMGF